MLEEDRLTGTEPKPVEAASAQALAPAFPLFYKRPELLHADIHANLRLDARPNFAFAAETNAVPIMVSEFGAALRFYPIVFAGELAMPVAVLGVDKRNLFVDDEGAWTPAGKYIPAYVRRYPFTFIAQGTVFSLGIDMACNRLILGTKAYKGAQKLFEEGKPTMLTQDAMRFCGALQMDHATTKAFADALEEKDLLIERRAMAVSGAQKQYNLHGFKIVDKEKLTALPDATVLDWHRKGWLGLIHQHLASIACWHDLVGLADACGPKEERL